MKNKRESNKRDLENSRKKKIRGKSWKNKKDLSKLKKRRRETKRLSLK